jgi:hypothetical protein
MKYLRRSFSVPVAGPSVTQEVWDAIFRRPKTAPGGEMFCGRCGSNMVVGLDSYRRCLACHACFLDGRRMSDTPRSFRI